VNNKKGEWIMKTLRFLNKSNGLISLLVFGALLLAACAPALPVSGGIAIPATVAPPAATAVAPAAAPASSTAAEAEINVATDPKLGKILVGNKGMTLYMYTKDAPDQSNCSGGCLKAWPPLTTQGSPVLGAGVDKSLVGTAALPDGSKIVTYNKMPLYYWAKDTKAGDVTGQNVGGVWYVVSPEGKVIGKPDAQPTLQPTAAPASGYTDAGEAQLNVATDPKLGKILVGNNGMTLYMYTKDGPDQSNCSGGCLKAWPPLTTQGNPVLGPGVDKSLVGTAALPDGSKIVTYNKMPLYYWAKDTKAGDVTGQNVGGVWYVVSPEGKVIGK
jgi:predicted lipoprotein with Yx(FWY)xxD motif